MAYWCCTDAVEYAVGTRQYAIDGRMAAREYAGAWKLATVGDKSTRDAGQRRGWSQTDGSAGEAPPPPRKPIGALTLDPKKDEQEDRDTIVACGAARRRRQRRPDVVLDSTPRRVAPPPDGTLRVAGAPATTPPAAAARRGKVKNKSDEVLLGISHRWRRVGAGLFVMFCVLSICVFLLFHKKAVGRANP